MSIKRKKYIKYSEIKDLIINSFEKNSLKEYLNFNKQKGIRANIAIRKLFNKYLTGNENTQIRKLNKIKENIILFENSRFDLSSNLKVLDKTNKKRNNITKLKINKYGKIQKGIDSLGHLINIKLSQKFKPQPSRKMIKNIGFNDSKTTLDWIKYLMRNTLLMVEYYINHNEWVLPEEVFDSNGNFEIYYNEDIKEQLENNKYNLIEKAEFIRTLDNQLYLKIKKFNDLYDFLKTKPGKNGESARIFNQMLKIFENIGGTY